MRVAAVSRSVPVALRPPPPRPNRPRSPPGPAAKELISKRRGRPWMLTFFKMEGVLESSCADSAGGLTAAEGIVSCGLGMDGGGGELAALLSSGGGLGPLAMSAAGVGVVVAAAVTVVVAVVVLSTGDAGFLPSIVFQSSDPEEPIFLLDVLSRSSAAVGITASLSSKSSSSLNHISSSSSSCRWSRL